MNYINSIKQNKTVLKMKILYIKKNKSKKFLY